MAKNTSKSTAREETALQKATDMLATGLGHLEDHIADRSGRLGDDAANSLAILLTKVAQVAAELRKAESHEQKAAGEITQKALADHIRRVSPAERRQLVRMIQDVDADQGRSGLA